MTAPEQFEYDKYEVIGDDPGLLDPVKLFNERVRYVRATWLQEAKVIRMRLQKKIIKGKDEITENYDFKLSDSETVIAEADPTDPVKVTISQKYMKEVSDDNKELVVTVSMGAAITALATFGYLRAKQKK